MSSGESPGLADVLRHAAAAWQFFRSGRSLDRALAAALAEHPELRPAVQDAMYTAVRHLAVSERVVERLAARPPAPDVAALLAVSLAQLQRESHAPHTVVDQAVRAAQLSGHSSPASGFVNAVLRNFLRQRAALLAELQSDASVRYNLPAWWLERLRSEYPNEWPSIGESQQQVPPLVLRVNARQVTPDDYLARLAQLGLEATRVGAHAKKAPHHRQQHSASQLAPPCACPGEVPSTTHSPPMVARLFFHPTFPILPVAEARVWTSPAMKATSWA